MSLNIKKSWLNEIYKASSHLLPFSEFKLFFLQYFSFEQKPFIITVGGTNGKGSVVGLLEHILVKSNTSVVVNTSPHLQDYNERVKLNGISIDDDLLIESFEYIDKCAKKQGIKLGFAHYAFLLVCYVAKIKMPEILVLEVGLGGKIDPSNCLDADIAVITNVDLDHMHLLGNTRDEIALNKLGIAREGKPLVIGDPAPPSALLEHVDAHDFKAYFIGEDYEVVEGMPHNHIHENNRATALKVCELIKDQKPQILFNKNIDLDNFHVRGRCQLIEYKGHKILIDVAHNEQAVSHLKAQILELKQKHNYKVSTLFSAMGEKDIQGMRSLMNPVVDQWHLWSMENYDARALSLSALQAFFQDDAPYAHREGLFELVFKDILDGLSEDELLVVFGSFVLVGECLNYLGKK
ncbi:Mur ligase family protein [Francisellaceae bacterium]|nr:Mur ligase family protein [Francisellaceae bacterium]